MEEWKKPEKGNAGTRERREKETEGGEKESRGMRLSNIAGENYVPPKEASPAYAPGEKTVEACEGGKPGEKKARIMRRANIAGECYVSPEEASPAYAPNEETAEARRGRKKISQREARILERSNIAGESFEIPVETKEPGKKDTDVSR